MAFPSSTEAVPRGPLHPPHLCAQIAEQLGAVASGYVIGHLQNGEATQRLTHVLLAPPFS